MLFFIVGLMHFFKTRNLIRKSAIIKGKIVDLKMERIGVGASRIETFIPIIEYIDENDSSIKIFKSNYRFPEGKYSIGDMLEIWYYSDGDETELMINNWFTKWVGIIFSVIGFSILIIGGICFFFYN